MILELAGDAPLVELVALRQFRRKRRYAKGETEVEVSLDSVDVVDRGRIVDTFRELEIELLAGDAALLEALTELLDPNPGLTIAEQSKFELALDAAGIVPGRSAGTESRAGGKGGRGRSKAATRHAAAGAAASSHRRRQGRGSPPRRWRVPVVTDDPAPDDTARSAGGSPLARRSVGERSVAGRSVGREPGARTGRQSLPRDRLRTVKRGAADAAEPGLPVLVVGKTPGVQGDDTLAEAGRKVLRFHLARMLAREPGTRAGDDPEELHAMRVATRRMRAAWRVFGDAYRPGRTRRYRRDLRDVAARLGAVRDLDVLLEGLEAYAKGVSAADRGGLEPLIVSWRRRREEARLLLLRTLDTPSYGRFVDEYREFVGTDGLAVLPMTPTAPHRVRDRMPSRIWAAYEQVRGYEPVLRWADVETLHDLRIAAKWLRYTIEFVREPLGPEAASLIERVVALQDHLGLLHDADVAAALARSYLVEHAGELTDNETAAIGRYLVDRERELARLRRSVGPTWRRVAGLTYRRALGRVIASL